MILFCFVCFIEWFHLDSLDSNSWYWNDMICFWANSAWWLTQIADECLWHDWGRYVTRRSWSSLILSRRDRRCSPWHLEWSRFFPLFARSGLTEGLWFLNAIRLDSMMHSTAKTLSLTLTLSRITMHWYFRRDLETLTAKLPRVSAHCTL